MFAQFILQPHCKNVNEVFQTQFQAVKWQCGRGQGEKKNQSSEPSREVYTLIMFRETGNNVFLCWQLERLVPRILFNIM